MAVSQTLEPDPDHTGVGTARACLAPPRLRRSSGSPWFWFREIVGANTLFRM